MLKGFIEKLRSNSSLRSNKKKLLELCATQKHLPYEKRVIDNVNRVSNEDWQLLNRCFSEPRLGSEVLEILRPAFSGIQEKYLSILDVVESHNYQVRNFGSYTDADLKGNNLFLYHDVHAWDIFPALAIADANAQKKICTTFFLNWKCDMIDVAHENAYLVFQHMGPKNVEVGLHAAPFSSWVLHEHFQSNQREFEAWVNDDGTYSSLLGLVDESLDPLFSQYRLADVREATLNYFSQYAASFMKAFPDAVSVNHHGDQLGRTIFKSRDTNWKQLYEKLHARHMLTLDCVEMRGFKRSIPTIKNSYKKPEVFHFWEGNRGNRYLSSLARSLERAAEHDAPVFLLNHPSTLAH